MKVDWDILFCLYEDSVKVDCYAPFCPYENSVKVDRWTVLSLWEFGEGGMICPFIRKLTNQVQIVNGRVYRARHFEIGTEQQSLELILLRKQRELILLRKQRELITTHVVYAIKSTHVVYPTTCGGSSKPLEEFIFRRLVLVWCVARVGGTRHRDSS